jgi:hypothetical protein
MFALESAVRAEPAGTTNAATGEQNPVRQARSVVTWLLVLALVLAPFIVNLTHPPAVETAAGGDIWHGHTDGHIPDGPLVGHDAADHEHQMNGLLDRADNPGWPGKENIRSAAPLAFSGAVCEGPRRPPRLV